MIFIENFLLFPVLKELWKSVENLRFDDVTAMCLLAPFYVDTVYVFCVSFVGLRVFITSLSCAHAKTNR